VTYVGSFISAYPRFAIANIILELVSLFTLALVCNYRFIAKPKGLGN
jgi:hypothetical protein